MDDKKTKPGTQTTEFQVTIIAVMFSLVAATVLLVIPGHADKSGMISAEQWMSVVKWVPTILGGLYSAGRVGLKIMDAKNDKTT